MRVPQLPVPGLVCYNHDVSSLNAAIKVAFRDKSLVESCEVCWSSRVRGAVCQGLWVFIKTVQETAAVTAVEEEEGAWYVSVWLLSMSVDHIYLFTTLFAHAHMHNTRVADTHTRTRARERLCNCMNR